ncbi:hypothetical protein PACTADRAFT_49570 [Pachysolen tannophilus NRRL Y-2460]|uniref:Amino acid permease/ SLC12A domain-containing protein n=1 Tax=Pachysolen tannophilus NRRL Y-2460 TaxID=669874 RepID=A0A1E4TWS5_PACTA|nr:hypothetical protein PACTADRAFT_49570 [Pachysolen tannophilus NRRL Y-2460]
MIDIENAETEKSGQSTGDGTEVENAASVFSASVESAQDGNSANGKSGWFHNFVDSFREMEIPEETNYEGLTQLEITNLKVAQSPLSRALKPRHVKAIAVGGCIGSGLFIGTGTALRTGGPASLLIGWAITGSMLYCVMNDLGELAVEFPVPGAFLTYNVRFIDSSWGFAMAWNYCLMWLIVLPFEIIATSLTVQYWNSDINSDAWVVIFYVFICVLNLFGAKGYGEAEFIASSVKFLAIVGFFILSIVLISGGGPNHDYIGVQYWHDPGAFADGFKGLCSVFVTAAYSLAGTELSALAAAGESENPRKTVPSAIKQVFWRVTFFYLTSLMFIGFLVPYNDLSLFGATSSADANTSPFVIAIKNAGIKGLPSVMNVVIMISVLSVGNAATYGCSRTLCSMATQGLAPKIFSYIDRRGRPIFGFLASAIVGLLCFISANKTDEALAFTWLLAISGLSALFTWGSISFSRIQFRRALKAQGRDVSELSFVSRTGLLGSIYAIIINILVLAAQFWIALFPIDDPPSANTFFENYLSFVVIIVFYVGHKLYTRNWKLILNPAEIDIDTGRREVDLELMKQEAQEDKERLASKPLYYRIYHYWC